MAPSWIKLAIPMALLPTLNALPASAQTLDQDAPWLSGGIGLSAVRGRDDLLVPLVWQGPGAALSLHFERKDGDIRRQADGQLGFAGLWNRFGHLGVAANASARYRQVHEIANFGNAGTLGIGGMASWQTEPMWFMQWDDSYLYWYTALAFAPSVQHIWQASPQSEVGVTLDWPLFGWVSRPPSTRALKIDPLNRPLDMLPLLHQDLRWSGPSELISPNLTVSWRYRPTSGPSWRFALELGSTYYPHPAPTWHERVGILSEVSFGL